jgi:hypothetical protein
MGAIGNWKLNRSLVLQALFPNFLTNTLSIQCLKTGLVFWVYLMAISFDENLSGLNAYPIFLIEGDS